MEVPIQTSYEDNRFPQSRNTGKEPFSSGTSRDGYSCTAVPVELVAVLVAVRRQKMLPALLLCVRNEIIETLK